MLLETADVDGPTIEQPTELAQLGMSGDAANNIQNTKYKIHRRSTNETGKKE